MSDKTRMRRDDLKALVLEAGAELLHEKGLGANTAPIGYVDAFRWLKEHHSISVSRAQVHRRIWNSLDEYRQDIMLAIASYTPDDSYVATIEAMDNSLADLQLAETSTQERTRLLSGMAVYVTEANANALRGQRSIAAFDAIVVMFALGNTESANTKAVQRKIIGGNRVVADRFIQLYEYLGGVFGAAPGSAWGLSQTEGLQLFSEVMSCLNHGASGRSAFEPSLQDIRVGGDTWSVEGLGAAAIASRIAMIDSPPCAYRGKAMPSRALVEPDSTVVQPRSGRLDRDTLRTLMIEAGVAVLIEHGFGHGAEQITYGRVFERIQQTHSISISRAQVHRRIWDSQNDFQLDLLRLATVDRMSLHADTVADRAATEIANTDLQADGGLGLAMARAIRVGAETTLATTIASVPWMLSQAVVAFHALNTDRRDIIGDALDRAYEVDVDRWAQVFKAIADALDYEAREWTRLTLDEVCVVAARCADVISDGAVLRTQMMGETSTYRVSIAGDEPRDWNLLAIGCWCVVDFLASPRRI